MSEDKITVERVDDSHKKFSVGSTLISIVPIEDTLYDPLLGMTREEAYNYVKDHSDNFDKISVPIRFGLLELLSNERRGEYRW